MGSGTTAKAARRWWSSFASRWTCLGIAALWGVLAMLVVLNLHLNLDHLTNIDGQPVMRTLYAHDPQLWIANFLGIGAAVAGAVVELAVRTHRRSTNDGVAAIILGSLLCLYSLFGLLYGIAAVAPIGVMVLLSGQPVRRQTSAVGLTASGVVASEGRGPGLR